MSSSNKEKWSFRGLQCSINFINGCDSNIGPDAEDKTGPKALPVGDHLFWVGHDIVCVGEEGAMQVDGTTVGIYDVYLDAPLSSDVNFGDVWYGPLGKEYYVVGTPTKCGVYNGVAASAGAQCITVISGCACRENVGGCLQTINTTIATTSTQIDSIQIRSQQITGPWTEEDFLDPQTGIKTMLRMLNLQVESFDWNASTGAVCIRGVGFGDAGTEVVINHS